MDAQAALKAAEIVVNDILPDHLAQLLPAGEFPAIIPFPLEDASEALHRPVVNTFAHSGHALCVIPTTVNLSWNTLVVY